MRLSQIDSRVRFANKCSCAVFAALIFLLPGCANLPNIQPFTDATVNLRSAVATSGASVVTELQQTGLQGANQEAKNLEAAWAERNRLLGALVNYAASLQAIVDAGKSGSEAAGALADAVKNLASAANIVEPGASAAAGVATDTAKFIYDLIAQARAAASLQKALGEVQPAIERITEIMAGEMKSLDDLVRVACQAERDAIKINNQTQLAYRESLLRSRDELLKKIRAGLDGGKKASEIPETPELNSVDTLIAAADTWYQPIQQQLTVITEREKLSRQLIAETGNAFADWSAAHAQLLAAVRAKRVPSVAELVQTAERIRALVARFKEL